MPCLPGPLHVLCGQRRLSLTPGVLGVRGVQWAFQVLSQSLRTRRSRDPSAAGSQRGTGRDCRHQGQSWSVLVALPDPARRQRAAALPPAAGGVDEALGAEGQGCTGTPDPAVQPPPAPWAGPRAGPPPACSARISSLGTQAQGEWGSSALLGHYLSLRGSASTSLRMQPCQAHAREASRPRLCGTAALDPPVPAPRRVLPPWVSGLQLCRP